MCWLSYDKLSFSLMKSRFSSHVNIKRWKLYQWSHFALEHALHVQDMAVEATNLA